MWVCTLEVVAEDDRKGEAQTWRRKVNIKRGCESHLHSLLMSRGNITGTKAFSYRVAVFGCFFFLITIQKKNCIRNKTISAFKSAQNTLFPCFQQFENYSCFVLFQAVLKKTQALERGKYTRNLVEISNERCYSHEKTRKNVQLKKKRSNIFFSWFVK